MNIYRVTPDQEAESVAYLCDDEWLLWPQIEALASWLEHSTVALQTAEYVADVGFCWRRDASAGGPVFEPAAMRRMAEILNIWSSHPPTP